MIAVLIRKAHRLVEDPVLRRWLLGRLLGRHRGEPAFEAHRPPYLKSRLPLPQEAPAPPQTFLQMAAVAPRQPLRLALPGDALLLSPGDERSVFDKSLADQESELALHRFAWLPLYGEKAEPAWVQALRSAWRESRGKADDSWSWHPYTAAERAINIIDFGLRWGLPAPLDQTLASLAAHAPAIAGALEYFGDHHTSNHLANNGRGLYRLGLALGLPAATEMGAAILLDEAKRIFAPCGVLREGSSHYHLLLARNYADAWLAARRHQRPEEPRLAEIAARALAVVPRLVLPGGLPLIGDISPDCPPPFLACMFDAADGWAGLLDRDAGDAFRRLRDGAEPVAIKALAADGWLRADFSPWSGLWHAAPGGWSHMPGHGHQDCGAMELHYLNETVFRDLGRGTYGETGAARLYRSARMHNTLTVDGHDPYPANKPYYDDAFRARLGGPPPELVADEDGVGLRHHGFARLRRVGAVERRWYFVQHRLSIMDTVEGRGRRRISRLLHTPLAVERDGASLILRGRDTSFRLAAEGMRPRLGRSTHWSAYGKGDPATTIEFAVVATLPWQGRIDVEAL